MIGLPNTKRPASVTWTLERNVVTSESPLSGTIQRVVRDGDRWAATLQWPPMVDDDAGIFAGFLDKVSRGDRWLYLDSPANTIRGNLGPTNLISNGDFQESTSGWTAEANITLSVNARRLKVTNASGSPAVAGGAYQNVTLDTSTPYVLVCDTDPGDTSSVTLEIVRQSDSGVEATTTFEGPERGVISLIPTEAAMRVRLVANSDGHVYFRNVSLHKCALVNGGAQTGNRLSVDGLPTSIGALLKAGEMFCVKANGLFELKRLTDDLDSDSGGTGTLVFEPGLRASPTDNAPIVFYRPFGRFMVPAHSNAVNTRLPMIHGFALDAVEDITP